MTAMAPAARLSLLGGFGLELRGEPVELPPGAQRLISFLALHPRELLRAFVAGSLWGEAGESQAGSSLRTALWRLGERAPVVETSATHVALAPWVETDVAQTLAVTQRLAATDEDPEPSDIRHLAAGGELLPGWYDDWLIVERERVRQRRLHTLEAACRRLACAGRFAEAVDAGLAAVAAEPLRESSHAAVIEVHLAQGNLIEASRQYEQLRDLLRDQLGARPSARVRELVHTYAAAAA